MDSVDLIVAIAGGTGLLSGIAAAITAWSNRRTPQRTVAIEEVDAALKVLGATIDRLEAENAKLHTENGRMRKLISELRSEVDRLRQVVEGGGL